MVNKIIPIVLLAIYIQCINSQKDYGQDQESKCREDQECVPLVSCNPVFELILDVKDDPVNSDWRRHVIDVIRERVCGPRMLRKVCCPKIPLVCSCIFLKFSCKVSNKPLHLILLLIVF